MKVKKIIFIVMLLALVNMVYSLGAVDVEASTERYVGSTWKYRIDNASSAKAKHVHFYKKKNGSWDHQLCVYSNGSICDANRNKLPGFSSLPSKVKKAAKADKSTGMKNLCACGGRFDGGGSGRNFFAYNLDSKDDDELWKIA